MSADVETEPVRITNKNRRILVRRTLIAAAVFLGTLIGYSFFLIFQFQSLVSAFQKQKADLLVYYENDLGDNTVTTYGSMPGPTFIPRLFIDYSHSVTYLNWQQQPKSSPKEIDELFALLPDFHKLEILIVRNFLIDEKRAAALSRIPQLKDLSLWDCQFEKSVLVSLLKKKGLKSLSLAGSTFQEEELSILKQAPAKETLTHLILTNCQISDQTAAVISECRNLEILHLDGTQITDMGLKMLARLPHLKVLVLDHTAVTDNGVSYLTGTPELVELSLSNTGVSDEVVDALKQEIPALRISDD
ncbi:MAG: hypothetical protein KDA70_09835 [Planctomycetaceae bacterium]|nr:hypothetical protein [Planctomycetaceae bacterium]